MSRCGKTQAKHQQAENQQGTSTPVFRCSNKTSGACRRQRTHSFNPFAVQTRYPEPNVVLPVTLTMQTGLYRYSLYVVKKILHPTHQIHDPALGGRADQSCFLRESGGSWGWGFASPERERLAPQGGAWRGVRPDAPLPSTHAGDSASERLRLGSDRSRNFYSDSAGLPTLNGGEETVHRRKSGAADRCNADGGAASMGRSKVILDLLTKFSRQHLARFLVESLRLRKAARKAGPV